MRYDRFLAYIDEISIDLGESVSRIIPDFNEEEKILEQIIKEEYAKKHNRK